MSIPRNLCFLISLRQVHQNIRLLHISSWCSILHQNATLYCPRHTNQLYTAFCLWCCSMCIYHMYLQQTYGISIFLYRLYHNGAYYMYPYRYFNKFRYSTRTPFFMRTFFLCSGFTSHMMYTNSPSIFNMIIFFWPVSIEVWPRDIKNGHTSLHSCASIIRLVIR